MKELNLSPCRARGEAVTAFNPDKKAGAEAGDKVGSE
jgi:hypothetical protein